MSKTHALRTTHLFHDSVGNECECEVDVEYVFHCGYPDTREEPGEPDSVEVHSVTPVIAGYEIGDVDLDAYADECMADFIERDAAARDDAAERRWNERNEV